MPPKGPKGPPPGKAGGGKKVPAGIAKLKAFMEQQKAEEERVRREEEERERQLREEERLAKEQEKLEEEQRRLEKERQKEEEKLRKKQVKSSQNDALERMRASGIIVPDVEKIRAETKNAPPIVYQKTKRAKAGAAAAAAAAAASSHFSTPSRRTGKGGSGDAGGADGSDEDEEGDETDDGGQTEPSESDEEVDEDDWEAMCERDERREKRQKKNAEIRQKRVDRKEERRKAREAKATEEEEKESAARSLRSPICCVLGHVDSGKTSLLDRIRSSNVQKGEAGGITQQIGATFFPAEGLLAAAGELREGLDMRVPGLLVIDTPGHESFTNLRSRGSSICDIAILVVDITHGLEPQTRESIRLLREQRCPFIVALNKVDRLYDWEPHQNMPFEKTLLQQKKYVQQEFENRLSQVQQELMAEGLNSTLYYRNKELRKVVSIVPTSAHTGEGICDLLMLEIKLVQEYMKEKVTLRDDLECTVLEVKPITGLGVTIDCILINGELHENDQICLCGQSGPIFTQIRFILTPQPMKEMRVKGAYEHHRSIKAAMGIKICANELESVVPGTSLVVIHEESKREEAAQAVMSDAARLEEMVEKDGMGVTVQSSTLGALEALLSYLRSVKIPVGSFAIGSIQKRHLYPAVSMKKKNPRYAVVLAFDVEVTDNAAGLAEKEGIQIFSANVIYHLFDRFMQYIKDYDESELHRLREIVVFPVQLAITGEAFHSSDPIVLPVTVVRGQLREGTPLCLVKEDEVVHVGRVVSMEMENKPLKKGLPGMEFAVKIHTGGSNITFGRHMDKNSVLFSKISRPSVNAIKRFREELKEDDINLLATLIKLLKVPN